MSRDVSVVISNYNTASWIQTCLRSTLDDLQRSGLDFEVVIVDDASTDGSGDAVASEFPEVTLMRQPNNQGYARATNAGIRATTGHAVLLLNSDTVVLPGSIPAMYAALRRRPNIAAVGATLLNADGTIQRSCWRSPLRSVVGHTLLLFRLGLWDDYRTWDHHADREVDCLSSAALMISRPALDDVGLLDEHFWVYGVDIDWSGRARRKGHRLLSVAAARVIHLGGASWSGMSERMFADHMRSNDRLFRKHYGLVGFALFRIVLLFNSAVRLMWWSLPYVRGRTELGPKVMWFRRLLRWSILGNQSEPVQTTGQIIGPDREAR